MVGSRVAVVTGGLRGVGRGVAERLASEGIAVALGYAAFLEAASEILRAMRSAGGRAVVVRDDVRDPEQVTVLFDRWISGQVIRVNGGVA